MKVFNEQINVGKAKHIVNFYDEVKQHKNGSPSFDIKIFKNKKKESINPVNKSRRNGRRGNGTFRY
jgi:hypothetical protein